MQFLWRVRLQTSIVGDVSLQKIKAAEYKLPNNGQMWRQVNEQTKQGKSKLMKIQN